MVDGIAYDFVDLVINPCKSNPFGQVTVLARKLIMPKHHQTVAYASEKFSFIFAGYFASLNFILENF
jgi:hypothetical protein